MTFPAINPRPAETPLLDEARRYVASGFVVLPVSYFQTNGEEEYRTNVPWKNRTETTDAELQAWFATSTYSGIALRTGSEWGFWVLDVDVKNQNGFESLANEGIDPWILSPVMARTPSGGLHVYLRTDKPVGSKTGWLPGVDIRGDGGLIYAPPSVRRDGTYSWVLPC